MNFPELTISTQEAFNQVWKHYIEENNPPGYWESPSKQRLLTTFDPETKRRCALGVVTPLERL